MGLRLFKACKQFSSAKQKLFFFFLKFFAGIKTECESEKKTKTQL